MDATDAAVDEPLVLVAGAGGDTGRALLAALSTAPVRTRALTSTPETVPALARRADEVVVGDLFSRADAERAVRGVDRVATVVGSTPRQVLRAETFVDGVGNRTLLAAAESAGVEWFGMLSSLGVGGDRDVPASDAGWLARSFRLLIAPVLHAKTETERAVRDANVTHTILRAPLLTNGPETRDVVAAAPGSGLWGAVSRRDVAAMLAAAPTTPAAADATVEVAGRRYPHGGGERATVDWRWVEDC